jgi:hypothetical protein
MGNAVVLLLDETRIVMAKRNPCEVDYCGEKGEENRSEKERRRPEQNSESEWAFGRRFLGKLTT